MRKGSMYYNCNLTPQLSQCLIQYVIRWLHDLIMNDKTSNSNPSRTVFVKYLVCVFRAVNNGLLDTYQLKSLDGLIEFNDVTNYKVVHKNGKLFLRDRKDNQKSWEFYDNDPLLMPYDYIIRCLGFQFDRSIFLK